MSNEVAGERSKQITVSKYVFGLPRCEKSFCKKFGEVFRSFREVFQSFCKFFEALGRVRTHSDPFGPAGTHSDALGYIRKRLDVFKKKTFFLIELIFDGFRRSFTKNLFHSTILGPVKNLSKEPLKGI